MFIYYMDIYVESKNKETLNKACYKMLQEKLNLILQNEELNSIIQQVSDEIIEEYKNNDLKISELNTLTLSRVKQICEKKIFEVNDKQLQNDMKKQILDDDILNLRLKELETRRKIIPTFSKDIEIKNEEVQQNNTNIQQTSLHNPISITLPENIQKSYKSFIINSLNRDWTKYPTKNFTKFNVAIDIHKHVFYPYCLCFPQTIKNITPYVLVNISDGSKNLFYTFTCCTVLSNWDIWKPIDNIEHIDLSKDIWSIKLYDFTNKELDLGKDNIDIIEVSQDEENFLLKLNSNDFFIKNDIVRIKNFHGITYDKIVLDYNENSKILTISDKENEFVINDFINAKLLILKNQFSFIIKYHLQS